MRNPPTAMGNHKNYETQTANHFGSHGLGYNYNRISRQRYLSANP